MNDFIKNTMAMVIIGDENNEKFDGKIKFNGKNDGFFYHRDSIKQIVNELNHEGYQLSNINFIDANEAGFDLVKKGHILFLNCTMENYCFGYLFLPQNITNKQIESLKLFEKTFQQFSELYLMNISKKDPEFFDTETISYDFDTSEILKNYYGINKGKTK